MKLNEFSASVTGSTEPIKIYKCLKWEERQIVSDEELAAYKDLISRFPAMVSEDYQTHEEVCIEYSGTEYNEYFPMPVWVGALEPHEAPILSKLGPVITFGDHTIPDID